MLIGQASKDENGRYRGGAAGDQTGKEVYITSWYNRPWDRIFRAKDSHVADKIADTMKAVCENDNVGYDQNERTTLYIAAQAVGYDISKIVSKVETDCSALVAVCVNAAGIKVSKDMYTGNERAVLMATGAFDELTDKKYLTSGDYLYRGDILLYTNHHTAVALEDGNMANKYTIGWHQDDRGWWYADTNKSYYRNRWAVINKHKYYFGNDGYALKGWQKIDGDWYYFEPSGDLESALYVTDYDGRQMVGEFSN